MLNSYTPVNNRLSALPSGFTMPDNPSFKVNQQTGIISISGDNGATWTDLDTKANDRTFVNSSVQGNGKSIRRSGIELTADFPEIRPIRTSFRIDASYSHSRFVDDTPYYYYNNGWQHTSLANRSYQYVGIYAGGNSVINGKVTDNIDANLTAITHIPQARLIVTLTESL